MIHKEKNTSIKWMILIILFIFVSIGVTSISLVLFKNKVQNISKPITDTVIIKIIYEQTIK